MTFPLHVKKESGRAESVSGGKDYHLVLICSGDEGRSILITRFGKKGTWGTGWKVQRFDDMHDALVAYNEKWVAKLGKAYKDHFLKTDTPCGDIETFRKALGPTLLKMKPEDLDWICPGIDTKDCRPAEEAGGWQTDEYGNKSFAEPKRRLVEEPKAPEVPVSAKINANPNWGLF